MSTRGNRQPSTDATDADKIKEHPGRTDGREDCRRKSRDEEERSEIDKTNWSSVKFDR
jgi:hypothetical protein